MLKVFISQPMNGRTDEEIKAERNKIIKEIEAEYSNEDVQIIDSFFEKAPHDAKPLWFIAKSIELLADADILCVAEGWEKARGCCIEYHCAGSYGIKTIEWHNDELSQDRE